MDTKKSKKADLSRLSALFFQIGLATSVLLVIIAFEYRAPSDEKPFVDPRLTNVFEDLHEMPVTDIPPPPPPVREQPPIEEAEDEAIPFPELANHDAEIQTASVLQAFVPIDVTGPVEDTDEIFRVVEESASPKEGMDAFYRYVATHLKYPLQARRMRVEGYVFVEFVVNRDGTLIDVKVIKGIGAGCDEEALRVLSSAPPWNPGKQRGRPVLQKIVIPIVFRLG